MTTSFSVSDFKSFASAVQAAYAERGAAIATKPLGHVQTLNLLCKAAGYKNYSHYLASRSAPPAAQAAVEPSAAVQKALLQFDDAGRLLRLPAKRSVQQLVVWALWLRFDAKRKYTEREVNAILNAASAFKDQATLRRELINEKLLARESDCSAYWKLAARPEGDALAFVRAYKLKFTA
jgi:hypothetical protein